MWLGFIFFSLDIRLAFILHAHTQEVNSTKESFHTTSSDDDFVCFYVLLHILSQSDFEVAK